MLGHTTKTHGSHGPDKRSHQKQAALTKVKGTPLLLKYLAAFCVLHNVGATSVATSVTPPSSCACAVELEAMKQRHAAEASVTAAAIAAAIARGE